MLIYTKNNTHAKIYFSNSLKKFLPVKIMYKDKKIDGYKKISQVDSSINLYGDYNNGISALRINGKTDQEITQPSKNLLDTSSLIWDKGYYNSATHIGNGITLKLNEPRTYTFKAAAIPISFLGKTITLSYSCNFSENWALNSGKKFTYVRIGYFKNGSFSSFLNKQSFEGKNISSITLPDALPTSASENILYLMANASTEVYNLGQTLTLANIMIREGNLISESQTVYEPFVPDKPSIDYPSPFLEFENEFIKADGENLVQITSNLSNIGNIYDYIEVQNGRVLKHQLIGKSTQNISDSIPNSPYLGTMTKNGISNSDGTINVKSGEEIRYILKNSSITDLTDTELGDMLLSINTEYGKPKTLSITNGSLTITQFSQP